MIERFISRTLESYLATFRVVLLVGARQAGKSTLVKQMAQAKGLVYRTFDNALEHFHRGIIFYQGTEVRRFAEKLYAVPLQALWQN